MNAPGAPGAFFDSFAERFDTIYDGQRGPLMRWVDRTYRSDMFERFRLTFEQLGDLTGRRGLDVGCGSGPYLAEALERGAAHLVGIDPAPGMLELARRRIEHLGALDRLSLVEGYFPAAAPTGTFDFAIVMGVMDYVADAGTFLRELCGKLTGPAAISMPSKHWLRTPLRKVRYAIRRCPVYFYDEPMIRELSARAGFSQTEIVKIPGAGMDYFVCLKP